MCIVQSYHIAGYGKQPALLGSIDQTQYIGTTSLQPRLAQRVDNKLKVDFVLVR